MKNYRSEILFVLSLTILVLLVACEPENKKWQGQAPLKKVDTGTRPIQYQLKKTYALKNGVFLSNNFDGARMNGVALTDTNEITVLITPENTPINESPWYAFKIWSNTPKRIQLKITYPEGVSHRYYPKVSKDKKNWTPVDSARYHPIFSPNKMREKPIACLVDMQIDNDTSWIAAQNGKAIDWLQIGNAESDKLLLVLSRQHPPEVTGWLAMKAFVEQLCAEDDSTALFRKNYCTCVVPCVNPDGVDLGHWRHSAAGIDLNRDWEAFEQPETQAVRKFIQHKVLKGKKFYCSIDFHSTWQDIYYTISPEKQGNMPGLIPDVIQAVANELPGYEPNISPSAVDALTINSSESIFHSFHAEAVTYEVGDDTPRDFIQKKATLFAQKLMKEMLVRDSIPGSTKK